MKRSLGAAVVAGALLVATSSLSPVAQAQMVTPPEEAITSTATDAPTCTPVGTPSIVAAQAGIPPVANRKPVAFDQHLYAQPSEALRFRLNAGDPDSDELVYSIGDSTELGPLSGNEPDLQYFTSQTSGTDSFTYTAWDGQYGATATVTITIGAAPAAATSSADASAATRSTRADATPSNPMGLQEFDRYQITVPQCASNADVTSYRIFAFDLLDQAVEEIDFGHNPEDLDPSTTLDVLPGQTTATVLVPRRGVPTQFRVSARNGKGTGPSTGPSAYGYAPFTSISAFVDDAVYRFRASWTSAKRANTKQMLGDPWSYPPGTKAPTANEILAGLNEDSALSKNQGAIVRLYMAYFSRMPDIGGLDYWVKKYTVAPKLKLSEISTRFAASGEFAPFRALSNKAFVTKVYRDVMGREPDTKGLTYWTNKLNAKTVDRGGVMVNFSQSSENVRKSRGYVDLVNIYRQMLGRMPSTTDLGADSIGRVPSTDTDAIRTSFRDRIIRTVRGLPGYTNSPLKVVTNGLVPGEVGTSYPDIRLDSIGGTSTGLRTWSTTGSLPTGMTLSPDGRLSGKPEAAGTYNVAVKVTAGSGASAQTASTSLSLRVDPAPASSCTNPAGLDRWEWKQTADGNWDNPSNWVHTPAAGSVPGVPANVPGHRVAGDAYGLDDFADQNWFARTYPPVDAEIQGRSIDPEPVTVGGVPAYDDYVCIPAFTPPVSLGGSSFEVTLAALDNFGDLTVANGMRLFLTGGPTWSIPSTSGGTLTMGGTLSGRGSLTIRNGSTMTWHGNCNGAGAMTTRDNGQYRIDTSLVAPHLAGRTIIAQGATAYIGVASGPACSHPQGINFSDERILINDGTIRVRGTAYVSADHGTRLDNFGTFEFAGAGTAADIEGRWVEGYGSGYPGLLGTSRITNAGKIDKVSGNGRAILAGTYVRPAGLAAEEGKITSGILEVLSSRFRAEIDANTSFSTGGCTSVAAEAPCPKPSASPLDPQIEVVSRSQSAKVTVERLPENASVWGYPVELTTTDVSAAAPITLDIWIDASVHDVAGAWASQVEVYYVPTPTSTSDPKLLLPCPASPTAAQMPCYTKLEVSSDADPDRTGDLLVTVKTDENSGYGAGRKGTYSYQRNRYRRCNWFRPRC